MRTPPDSVSEKCLLHLAASGYFANRLTTKSARLQVTEMIASISPARLVGSKGVPAIMGSEGLPEWDHVLEQACWPTWDHNTLDG